MEFSDGPKGKMQMEWALLHPDAKALLVELEHWSQASRITPPVVTDLLRPHEENARIYTNRYKDLLQEAASTGVLTHLNPVTQNARRRELTTVLRAVKAPGEVWEKVLRGQLLDVSERATLAATVAPDLLEAEARKRFSWHCVRTAVDLRTKHYQGNEKGRVHVWLYERTPKPGWEFLEHEVVGGNHFHLAKEDLAWKARHWLKGVA